VNSLVVIVFATVVFGIISNLVIPNSCNMSFLIFPDIDYGGFSRYVWVTVDSFMCVILNSDIN
jgi:hypothetical protein